MDTLHSNSLVGGKEKWLRIITSIGALYLEGCFWGAIQPLVSEWDWAMSNVTRDGVEPQAAGESETETRASFAVAAIFLVTGLMEVIISPIAGAVADRFGFDAVIAFSLSCGAVQSVLFGCFETSAVVIFIYRILQGASNASSQAIALARIRDMYSLGSRECTTFFALGISKTATGYFSSLLVGELYHSMKNRVFFLFTPFSLLFIIGVMLTFRTVNFHSKDTGLQSERSEYTSSSALQWRIFLDVQLLVLVICCFLPTLAYAAFEPSVAVWMKSAYGAGPATVGIILGLCGLVSLVATIASAQILHIMQDRSWIFFLVTLLMIGPPLILMNFSPDIITASIALCAFFIALCAVRFAPLEMCSTIADSRYPQSCGQVFSIVNASWGASFVVGPLLAPYFFGSTCGVCIVGAACMTTAPLAIFLRHLDSKQGPNIWDCCKDHRPDYKMVATNDVVPFTYDTSKHTLQPMSK